jgi:hypothetical protein
MSSPLLKMSVTRDGEIVPRRSDSRITLARQTIGFGLPARRALTLRARGLPPSTLTHPRRRAAENDSNDESHKQIHIEGQFNRKRRIFRLEGIEDQRNRLPVGNGDRNENGTERKRNKKR